MGNNSGCTCRKQKPGYRLHLHGVMLHYRQQRVIITLAAKVKLKISLSDAPVLYSHYENDSSIYGFELAFEHSGDECGTFNMPT